MTRVVLSFPHLREFKKRLEKEAGWDALEKSFQTWSPRRSE